MSGISDAQFLEDAYIQDGASPAAGVVVVGCTVGDDYDDPKSRVGVRRDGAWLEFGFSGEALVSLDAGGDGRGYALGENGTVLRFDWETPRTRDEFRASRALVTNPAVEGLGPLRRVRVIGGDVLCAGSVGQVYRLAGDTIEAMPRLEVDGERVTIEDLAGRDANDFVAVTSDGHAARFDGSSWNLLDLPVRESLGAVCALEGDGYAIAGGHGTVVVGAGATWQTIAQSDTGRSYYGVAVEGDAIYLAHLGGIDRVSASVLTPLDVGTSPELEFTVLRAGPDGVSSFAGTTIGLIRGGRFCTVTV